MPDLRVLGLSPLSRRLRLGHAGLLQPVYWITKVQIRCHACAASFVAGAGARFYPDCRRPIRKYLWTEEKDAILKARYDPRIRNRVRELASLLGWPGWVIKCRAAVLGLTRPWPVDRKSWTPDEERMVAGPCRPPNVIERWVREGKLRVSRRNPDLAEGRQPWQVPDREVLRFIRSHPLALRLDKVDQVWFMDLVGGGLLRPATAVEVA